MRATDGMDQAMHLMKRFAGFCLLLGLAGLAQAAVPDIPAAESPCVKLPRPDRWLSAGDADTGRAVPLVSSHRGALSLAPENTLWAYRYALAYEVALIEVDVRQTADRRFVAFHDSDLAAKSNGEGRLEDLTYDQARALNVADYPPWKGSVYDPSQMASLEEVLELARATGHGIEFDMKFMLDSQPTADLAGFAAIVNRYPEVLRRSIINLPPPAAQLGKALIPEGRFIYNLLFEEPPALLYGLARQASVFGSDLAKFSREKIAAIHDGCGLVMPHSYDAGREREGEQILLARSLGADGVQTNQPALARALLVGPVATALVPGTTPSSVCLVNRDNGLGLPQKTLRVRKTDGSTLEVRTELAGCAELPMPLSQADILFDGDASAAPAERRLPDADPDPFSFGVRTGVAAGSWAVSQAIEPLGYTIPTRIRAGTGTEYSLGCTQDNWTAAQGTISPGTTICVRHSAAGSPNTLRKTSLQIGKTVGYFTTRTEAP